MSTGDPIASSTLASLYISQGHDRKALNVVNALLERDPFDGTALALGQRLRAGGGPTLNLLVDDAEIRVKWTHCAPGPEAARWHVVISWVEDCGFAPRTVVDSRACEKARGTWALPRPSAGGAAIACIGRVEPTGFVPAVVARAVPWSAAISAE